MSLFRKKQSLDVTEASPSYKVKYLGNVATSLSQGEACVDKPVSVLWNNYLKTEARQSVAMKLTVDNAGLKVSTSAQGETQYWCHRVSKFSVPSAHPRLFAWVYRHVGKRMKAELRCHAVLFPGPSTGSASAEKRSADVARRLAEKKAASLHEYVREKSRRHKTRLVLDKAQAAIDADASAASATSAIADGLLTSSPGATVLSSGTSSTEPARKRLLNPGRNYKPPLEYSLRPPALDVIREADSDDENEEVEEDEVFKAVTPTGNSQMMSRQASRAAFRSSMISLDRFEGEKRHVTGGASHINGDSSPKSEHSSGVASMKSSPESLRSYSNGDSDDEAALHTFTAIPLDGGSLTDQEDDEEGHETGGRSAFFNFRTNGALTSSEESLNSLEVVSGGVSPATSEDSSPVQIHKLSTNSLKTAISNGVGSPKSPSRGFQAELRSRSAGDLSHSSVLGIAKVKGQNGKVKGAMSPLALFRNGDINCNEPKSPSSLFSNKAKDSSLRATEATDLSQRMYSTLPSQRHLKKNGSAAIKTPLPNEDNDYVRKHGTLPSSKSNPSLATLSANGSSFRLKNSEVIVIGSATSVRRSASLLKKKGLYNLLSRKQKSVTLTSISPTLPD